MFLLSPDKNIRNTMRLANRPVAYPDQRLGKEVVYQVASTPWKLAMMYVTGLISGLMGIGSARNTLFHYTGHPAVILPYGQDRESLPHRIQVVSKRWSESLLLAIAQALVPMNGPFRRPL